MEVCDSKKQDISILDYPAAVITHFMDTLALFEFQCSLLLFFCDLVCMNKEN